MAFIAFKWHCLSPNRMTMGFDGWAPLDRYMQYWMTNGHWPSNSIITNDTVLDSSAMVFFLGTLIRNHIHQDFFYGMSFHRNTSHIQDGWIFKKKFQNNLWPPPPRSFFGKSYWIFFEIHDQKIVYNGKISNINFWIENDHPFSIFPKNHLS